MREIKFRAWESKLTYMHDDVFVYGSGNVYTSASKTFGTPNTEIEYKDDMIVMQFTGLQDRNGVDIYEGDILCFQMTAKGGLGLENDGIDKIVGPVEFGEFNPDCSVLSDYIGFHVSGRSLKYKLSEKNCRVIGNIHQNPELL